jgi:hypothetical protein
MSDEEQAVAEISPAPEPEATAAPDVPQEPTPEKQQHTKTFSQEELDAIVSKRLAREQRKWEREQAQRLAELQATKPVAPPTDPNDFESAQQYAEVLAEQKAQELLAKREAARQQAEIVEAYKDREEEAREKYEDFEQVAYNPNLPVTDHMAQAIQASDIGPEVIYYLGSNPKEAGRISRLPPILQAKEIGKIEANLASNPPVKKTSTAPAPLAPVTATRSSSSPKRDTTDPRSVKEMSTSEWIEAERLRQIRKWEAQNRR